MKITTATSHSFHQMGGRGNQEDSRYPDVDIIPAGQRVFIVCDGVGGCDNGEVASQLVASIMGTQLEKANLDMELTDDQLLDALDEAYIALDNAATSDHDEMGTTLTLLCFHAGGATMAHIGDSRIYHIRPGEGILYRSDDHSLVNQMVHNGQLTPEEAVNHPQSNVITRCMSPTAADQRRSMATVFHTANIEAGDYVMLCSDGVLHCMSDDELVALLEGDGSDEAKAHEMASRSAGSSDNNTAWLVRVEAVERDASEELKNDSDSNNQPDASDTVQSHGSTMWMSELASERRGKQSLKKRWFRLFGK